MILVLILIVNSLRSMKIMFKIPTIYLLKKTINQNECNLSFPNNSNEIESGNKLNKDVNLI